MITVLPVFHQVMGTHIVTLSITVLPLITVLPAFNQVTGTRSVMLWITVLAVGFLLSGARPPPVQGWAPVG